MDVDLALSEGEMSRTTEEHHNPGQPTVSYDDVRDSLLIHMADFPPSFGTWQLPTEDTQLAGLDSYMHMDVDSSLDLGSFMASASVPDPHYDQLDAQNCCAQQSGFATEILDSSMPNFQAMSMPSEVDVEIHTQPAVTGAETSYSLSGQDTDAFGLNSVDWSSFQPSTEIEYGNHYHNSGVSHTAFVSGTYHHPTQDILSDVTIFQLNTLSSWEPFAAWPASSSGAMVGALRPAAPIPFTQLVASDETWPAPTNPQVENRILTSSRPHTAQAVEKSYASASENVAASISTAKRKEPVRLAPRISNSYRMAKRDARQVVDVDYGRPSKRRKVEQQLQKMPGYSEFRTVFQGVDTIRHNSRYGKPLSAAAKVTREVGACVRCRFHKYSCKRGNADEPCLQCTRSLPTEVNGIRLSACMTKFSDMLPSGDVWVELEDMGVISCYGIDMYFYGIGDTNMFTPEQANDIAIAAPTETSKALQCGTYFASVLRALDDITSTSKLRKLLTAGHTSHLLQQVTSLMGLMRTSYLNMRQGPSGNQFQYLGELAEHILTLIFKALPSWSDRCSSLSLHIQREASDMLKLLLQTRPDSDTGYRARLWPDYKSRFQNVFLSLGRRGPREMIEDGTWAELSSEIIYDLHNNDSDNDHGSYSDRDGGGGWICDNCRRNIEASSAIEGPTPDPKD